MVSLVSRTSTWIASFLSCLAVSRIWMVSPPLFLCRVARAINRTFTVVWLRFIEFRKQIRAERQNPDHIFCDVGHKASGELIDENKEPKAHPVIIRTDPGLEEKVKLEEEFERYAYQAKRSKEIAGGVGNTNSMHCKQ